MLVLALVLRKVPAVDAVPVVTEFIRRWPTPQSMNGEPVVCIDVFMTYAQLNS